MVVDGQAGVHDDDSVGYKPISKNCAGFNGSRPSIYPPGIPHVCYSECVLSCANEYLMVIGLRRHGTSVTVTEVKKKKKKVSGR